MLAETATTPEDHPNVKRGKIGLLLVNLGTPDNPSRGAVRRYLRQFLADRRVIEVNPVVWKLVLNFFILPFRPAKVAHAYQSIWLRESDESPLRYYTRRQAEKLRARLEGNDERWVVEWAMRYGNPDMESRIQRLVESGCDKLIVLPLYPQYSATTTATVCDEAFRTLMRMRWQPTLRVAAPYDSHSLYIEALAASIEDHVAELDWEPDAIIASFHGIPQEYFEKGDPYYCFCHKTVRLLRERLRQKMGDKADRLQLTFQSRFGPREWLQPYTDKTLESLAQGGVKKVAVLCPGFAADCLETLEEMGIAGKETFEQSGGTHFTLIPCLNERDDHIALLARIAHDTASGWDLQDQ